MLVVSRRQVLGLQGVRAGETIIARAVGAGDNRVEVNGICLHIAGTVNAPPPHDQGPPSAFRDTGSGGYVTWKGRPRVRRGGSGRRATVRRLTRDAGPMPAVGPRQVG